MGFLEREFLGRIASFERRLQGAAQTPLTLCLFFRCAPRRERGWRLSETSEKCAKILSFERYSTVTLQMLIYGETDEI